MRQTVAGTGAGSAQRELSRRCSTVAADRGAGPAAELARRGGGARGRSDAVGHQESDRAPTW